jgi:hypothetical protein
MYKIAGVGGRNLIKVTDMIYVYLCQWQLFKAGPWEKFPGSGTEKITVKKFPHQHAVADRRSY